MSVLGPQQVLELAKVSRTFGDGATAVAALRDVDLTIGAGEFVAVMGPSGSGKSPSWRCWSLCRSPARCGNLTAGTDAAALLILSGQDRESGLPVFLLA